MLRATSNDCRVRARARLNFLWKGNTTMSWVRDRIGAALGRLTRGFAALIAIFAVASIAACAESPAKISTGRIELGAESSGVQGQRGGAPTSGSLPVEEIDSVHAAKPSKPDNARARRLGKIIMPASEWPADILASHRKELDWRLASRWSWVGALSDTAMLQLCCANMSAKAIVVSDVAAGVLLGLDRNTGSIIWRSGKRGRGPREFIQPIPFLLDDSTIIVNDVATRRLSEWTTDGRFLSDRSVASVGSIRGVCRSSGGALLVGVRPDGGVTSLGLGQLDPERDSIVVLWSLPIDPPPHRTGIDAQMIVVPDGIGGCYLFPLHESWVADVDSAGRFTKHELVEHVARPLVLEEKLSETSGRTRLAPGSVGGVKQVATMGSFVLVLFGGRTSGARRLIDVYERTSWRYLGTLLFRERIKAVHGRDSMLVVLSEDESGFDRMDVIVARWPELQ